MFWITECHQAMQWGNNLRIDLCKSKQLGYLALLVTIVTLATGIILFVIDPNIKSPLDGIWSAWVTMTHVGFGDVVPTSFFGRILSAGLILLGLLLFPLFTALISVALIGKNMNSLGLGMQRFEQEAHNIHGRENKVLAELTRLQQSIEELEKRLSANTAQK